MPEVNSYPKLDKLHALCDIERPEVVCITETWLCDDIGESEFSIPGYNCVLDVIGTDMVVELHCLCLTIFFRWEERKGEKSLCFPCHERMCSMAAGQVHGMQL